MRTGAALRQRITTTHTGSPRVDDNGGMEINASAQFAADPQTVYTMLTTLAYQERLVAAANPIRSDVAVDGNQTTATRVLASPPEAARFTGPELTVVEKLVWGPADADGSRTAEVSMIVPKQPVTMKGTVRIAPGGPGTTVSLVGDLKVNVPLLGRKLEQSSAPAILEAFNDHQKVGDAWLAEHA